MQYAFLLWPHANLRYRASLKILAEAELSLMLTAVGVEGPLCWKELGGADWLCFDAPNFGEQDWRWLSQHAATYVMALREGEALRPVARTHPNYIGEDLPALLKYKGKTNELFTDMLLNVALASSDFATRHAEPLQVLDPLCGRGTALFLALRRGWHAAGIDIGKADVKEINDFFSRYLEYHRWKHKKTESTLTVRGKVGGRQTRYDLADTPERWKQGDTRSLRVVMGDTRDTATMFGRNAFHLLVADLPYGVQHAPATGGGRAQPIEVLIQEALPVWREALKPGGAAAISFNTFVTPRKKVEAWMEEAGLVPCVGGAYGSMEHWVEQAVNRDVVVGKKPGARPAEGEMS